MNPYLQEVLDAHVLIERWLSQGEGSAEALMSRFAAEFTMIPLSGEKMDYPTVSRFFHQAGRQAVRDYTSWWIRRKSSASGTTAPPCYTVNAKRWRMAVRTYAGRRRFFSKRKEK